MAVRPAGAPMVEMPRPGREGNGDGSATAVAATVADEARETGKQVAQEARQAGAQIADDARRAAQDQIDQRSTLAGERVHTAAGDARDIAQMLRGKGREGPARVADEAATRMDRFADYLRDADGDRIMADVRRVGRERPGVLVAGAAAAGILLGRLVKASEPAGTATNGGPR